MKRKPRPILRSWATCNACGWQVVTVEHSPDDCTAAQRERPDLAPRGQLSFTSVLATQQGAS